MKYIGYDKSYMLLRKFPIFDELIQYTDEDIHIINAHLADGLLSDNIQWIFSNNNIKTFIHHTYLLLNRQKLLNFKDMYCLENSTSISINPYGYFRGLNCDISAWSLKSLYKPINFKLIPKPVKCTKQYCSCIGNISVLKFVDKDMADKYCNEK